MCVGGSSDENGPGMIWGASLAKFWDREQLNVTNSMMKFYFLTCFSIHDGKTILQR